MNLRIVLLFALASALVPFCAAGETAVVAWGAGTFVAKPPDLNDFGQSLVPASLTNATQVAAGWRHSLALRSDGSLAGWGDDTLGQLDFNVGETDFVAVACGRLHSLALRSSSTVAVAGDDSFGQTDVPSNLSNVVAVAGGFFHSLALKTDGSVVAWGPSTNNGSIGIDPDYGQTLVPAGLANVVSVAAGGWHSLALLSDGTVRGWGRDDYGQAEPPNATDVIAISAGAVHSLILHADGTVTAWGQNTYGQTNVPSGLSGVVAIAAGGWHNLALRGDGTVVAWGAGGPSTNAAVAFGQNMVPVLWQSQVVSGLPIRVPTPLSNVVQIAAGQLHSLALIANGSPVRPYTFAEATYYGLFADYTNGVSSASAGAFTLSMTTKGAFSGAIQLGAARYSLHGHFGTDGLATNIPATRGKNSLNVSLEINPNNPNQMGGTVSSNGATWVATLYGNRAVFNGSSAIAPQKGRYTLIVPGNADPANTSTPGGDSFGTTAVDGAGHIHLAASLADGTKTAQAASVSSDGWWPLYLPLYGGQGLVWSWLSFSSDLQLQGEQFVWIKPPVPRSKFYPGGFTVETNAIGSPYGYVKSLPVLGFTNASIVLSGAGLASPLMIDATNQPNGKVRGDSRAALSFNLSTGSFTGSATPGGGKSITFSGVALTNANLASGFFLNTNGLSGQVLLISR